MSKKLPKVHLSLCFEGLGAPPLNSAVPRTEQIRPPFHGLHLQGHTEPSYMSSAPSTFTSRWPGGICTLRLLRTCLPGWQPHDTALSHNISNTANARSRRSSSRDLNDVCMVPTHTSFQHCHAHTRYHHRLLRLSALTSMLTCFGHGRGATAINRASVSSNSEPLQTVCYLRSPKFFSGILSHARECPKLSRANGDASPSLGPQ